MKSPSPPPPVPFMPHPPRPAAARALESPGTVGRARWRRRAAAPMNADAEARRVGALLSTPRSCKNSAGAGGGADNHGKDGEGGAMATWKDAQKLNLRRSPHQARPRA